MLIRDLFVSDVTRDIPPVVYFHEQAPAKLADEVSEYIVTGGWPASHPNHRRVPDGIHEQYVRLLTAIASELDRNGGPDLPNSWISGFYGSGKSSFAKLLGLALDGVALSDGTSLAEAWLRRDTSPRANELREAWRLLRQKVDPIAVVFDVGGIARDNEHIHSAAVRQVQRRLGYCSTEPLVADFELRLERDGGWAKFERVATEILGRPWAEVKDKALAEEDFSLVLSKLFPDRYSDPMSWFTSRGGTHARSESPEEAVAAIGDMLRFRRPGSTLFMVVDEVSQYVLSSKDRTDRLRAFATALGAGLKGKAWLLALGQQKLDEDAGDSFLIWAKDRFPPKLRVHLAATNIRDVVHKRLLQKTPAAERQLLDLFGAHRPDLKLFAYGCDAVTPDEFVEVYPMLPGHIDLLLQITSALRTRSARAQGDDQAIRGLLQLLGELFRDQKLAELPVGALVTLDRIYEVQHTALDSDVQASMARVLSQCADDESGLMVRAAKAVALLELIQDAVPTDAKLVAQCLYDRVDRGNQVSEVTEALEELRRRNLLGYSEKLGYRVQSSAGEEWERERRDIGVPRETISESVQGTLGYLMGTLDRPRLEARPFPWAGVFSDGRRAADATVADPRDDAAVCVDFRFLSLDERTESTWVRRSVELALENRLVWVAGDTDRADTTARELARSLAMVKKYKPRRESLNAARKLLLQQEENRAEDLGTELRDTVAGTWMAGRMYFRGRPITPHDHGAAFASALHAAATRVLPDLFPHFVDIQVLPAELLQLLEPEMSGPSPKFLTDQLGILELDSGRYVASCSGVVPRRVQEYIEAEGGLGGAALLAHFGRPPYGYTIGVLKACIAGLLRASRLRVQPESGSEITAVRDAGVRDLFDKDRAFRQATLLPAGEDDIGFQARARICKFFEQQLHHPMDREDQAIADAVALHFPQQAEALRWVLARLNRLPDPPKTPAALDRLNDVLEQCVRSCRQTRPTVMLVKKHLDALRDGVQLLQVYSSELTDAAVEAVRTAASVRDYQLAQLRAENALPTECEPAAGRLTEQLGSERPWRDIAGQDDALTLLRAAYAAERQRLLEWQEQEVEQARGHIKARDGFSTLTADQSHHVLRPLADAATNTTPEAIAPALAALKDSFVLVLRRAEEKANELLDEILSEGSKPLIVRMDLSLRNREVADEADVEALVGEIRERLLEQVHKGARIRLL
jgi:hypothetical protein